MVSLCFQVLSPESSRPRSNFVRGDGGCSLWPSRLSALRSGAKVDATAAPGHGGGARRGIGVPLLLEESRVE